MKTTIFKNIAIWFAISGLLASSAFAIANNDLSKYILEEMKIQENLTDSELEEIQKFIGWISKKDVLAWLKEEINNIKDWELKKWLIKSSNELSENMKAKEFVWKIDSIYEKMDDYYKTNVWEVYTDSDFPKSYNDFTDGNMGDINVKKTYTLEDFPKPYNDSGYENMNEFELEIDWKFDFNFKDLKKEISKGLLEEFSLITDVDLKNKFISKVESIQKNNNENDFFKAVDSIYNNDELNNYYLNKWITLLDDENLENFDFDNEKWDIIKHLEIEISELPNETLKKELKIKISELKKETEKTKFLDRVDIIYNVLDSAELGDWEWLGY